MWQEIEESISRETGELFHITNKQELSTCGLEVLDNKTHSSHKHTCQTPVNLSFRISNGFQHYFIKLNNKESLINFQAEAYSLKQLGKLSHIACPKVASIGIAQDKSFLALEHVNFSSAKPLQWYDFGHELAVMHQETSHGQFGWQHDNFIRDTIQPNHWRSNWSVFFAEQRIAWQLQLLMEKSILLGDIDYISQFCHDLLSQHYVTPCLVHGDLWQGNTGFTCEQAMLFDPACYYGDREVDIAMTELFGQFPDAFYHGYQDQYPLESGYLKRKSVYNFYHILNNANTFGGIYIDQAKAALTSLLSINLH